MLFLCIILFIIGGVCVIALNNKSDVTTKLPNYKSPTYNPLKDGGVISLHPRKGYTYFELTGLSYHLTKDNYGKFNGYAIAETDNKFDNYAVAIYADGEHKIGYIPKHNINLHSYIQQEGGKVHAYGYVQKTFNKYLNGAVCIETNKNIVTRRGMPYQVYESDKIRFDGSTYTPTMHNFVRYESKTNINNWVFPQEWKGKKFSMIGSIPPYTQEDVANWIKSNGGAFVKDISSKVHYIIDFDTSTYDEQENVCQGEGMIKKRILANKYNTPCIKPISFFLQTQGEYKIINHKCYY